MKNEDGQWIKGYHVHMDEMERVCKTEQKL
jgi:hypothetical protein